MYFFILTFITYTPSQVSVLLSKLIMALFKVVINRTQIVMTAASLWLFRVFDSRSFCCFNSMTSARTPSVLGWTVRGQGSTALGLTFNCSNSTSYIKQKDNKFYIIPNFWFTSKFYYKYTRTNNLINTLRLFHYWLMLHD
jgi:hypothetical protein